MTLQLDQRVRFRILKADIITRFNLQNVSEMGTDGRNNVFAVHVEVITPNTPTQGVTRIVTNYTYIPVADIKQEFYPNAQVQTVNITAGTDYFDFTKVN